LRCEHRIPYLAPPSPAGLFLAMARICGFRVAPTRRVYDHMINCDRRSAKDVAR